MGFGVTLDADAGTEPVAAISAVGTARVSEFPTGGDVGSAVAKGVGAGTRVAAPVTVVAVGVVDSLHATSARVARVPSNRETAKRRKLRHLGGFPVFISLPLGQQ